ncbi:hypothetical protein ACIQ9P_03665 [Kitasatospora sp. NPDC094019]|uniref:hypothetical protein n=1 Tax=Kitasatospora sp. NPDC094019 TaxID=3364091 RepID=UPI0038134678
MFDTIARETAALIHNPGIQARAILNSVYVDVTPDDERTVKIAFGPAVQGLVQVDFTLLDAKKAHVDTVSGAVRAADASEAAFKVVFDLIEVWFPPVA